MVRETIFVTIMNNVTASQRAYPPISKVAKMDYSKMTPCV